MKKLLLLGVVLLVLVSSGYAQVLFNSTADWSGVQGNNSVYYLEKQSSGAYTDFTTYSTTVTKWHSGGQNAINKTGYGHPGASGGINYPHIILAWMVEQTGTYNLSMQLQRDNAGGGNGHYISIMNHSNNTLTNLTIAFTDLSLKKISALANLTNGQYVYYYISSNGESSYDAFNNSGFVADLLSPQNLFITANDYYDSSSISNFSALINETQYNTTTGTLNTDIPNNSTSLFNITIMSNQSGGYFNRTYLDYNVSTNLQAQLWQAELLIYPKELISGNNITGGNFTVGSQTVNNGNPLKLKAGNYNVTFQHPNYLITITNFSVSALQNLSVNMSIGSAQLNITAFNLVAGSGIQNFTVNITSKNFSTILSTTNYTLYAGLDINRTYNLTISAFGFELKNATVYLQNITQKYNFTLYTANSVVINIFNEATGAPLYENVSIKFTGTFSENTYYTNTSTYYKDTLLPGEYQLLFSATGYSPRTYTITVGNQTSQTLKAYLAANTSTTLFTITDFDTSTVLSEVLSTMYKFINEGWQPIESKYSDITGKVQFNYLSNTNYKFYLSKSGYQDSIFYLNPILFNTYDVKMHSVSALSLPQEELNGVSVLYSSTKFYNNNISNFAFYISSPSGLLQSYSYTITYPGGSDSQSGSNAIGGQLNSVVNITNATALNVVILNYYYLTSSGASANTTVTFSIIVTSSASTFTSTMSAHYGLTLFERMLISTIIIIFVVGIASLVGQPLMGLLLGLVVFLYVAITGFIPIYLILPSLVIGVFFLFWRSGG